MRSVGWCLFFDPVLNELYAASQQEEKSITVDLLAGGGGVMHHKWVLSSEGVMGDADNLRVTDCMAFLSRRETGTKLA